MNDTAFDPRSCVECEKPLPDVHDDWMEGECEGANCGATHYLCPESAEAAGFFDDDEPDDDGEPVLNLN